MTNDRTCSAKCIDGRIYVEASLIDPSGKKQEIELLVDTGAWVPLVIRADIANAFKWKAFGVLDDRRTRVHSAIGGAMVVPQFTICVELPFLEKPVIVNEAVAARPIEDTCSNCKVDWCKEHEPVIPRDADEIMGLIGLRLLGRRYTLEAHEDGATVRVRDDLAGALLKSDEYLILEMEEL